MTKEMAEDASIPPAESGMGAENFGFFIFEPYIPSVYVSVGGTPKEDFGKTLTEQRPALRQ